LTSGAHRGKEDVLAASYIRAHLIADERRIYYPDLGLLLVLEDRRKPQEHIWAELGLRRRASEPSAEARVSVGLLGYYAGPRQVTIDLCALTDPLLARLPAAAARGGWRIGHFVRTMPDGYLESVRTGRNHIRDKDLAEYYDRLCLVTRGRLLIPARLLEIVRFNLGMNDHLLRSYRDAPPLRATVEEINRSAAQGGTAFGHSGLEIVLGGLCHNRGADVRIEYGSYCFIFCRGGRGISSLSFWTPPQGGAMATWRIDVPYPEIPRGYDSILVVPIIEEGPHRIESVHLLGEGGAPRAAGASAESAADD
jgi:arabinofuranosyltransferase